MNNFTLYNLGLSVVAIVIMLLFVRSVNVLLLVNRISLLVSIMAYPWDILLYLFWSVDISI